MGAPSFSGRGGGGGGGGQDRARGRHLIAARGCCPLSANSICVCVWGVLSTFGRFNQWGEASAWGVHMYVSFYYTGGGGGGGGDAISVPKRRAMATPAPGTPMYIREYKD